MALWDFYASHGHYRTRIVLNSRDSKDDVVAAAAGVLSNCGFQKANIISGNSTDLETFGVSQIGPKLLQDLVNTTFTGKDGHKGRTGGPLRIYKVFLL